MSFLTRKSTIGSRAFALFRLDDVQVKDVPVAGQFNRQIEVLCSPSGPRCSARPTCGDDRSSASMCLSFALKTAACRSSRRLLKPKLCTLRAFEPWLRSLRTLASMSALLVTSAPLSPKVPRFFWMMKLVVAASLRLADLETGAGRADGLGIVFDDTQLDACPRSS